jgi:hypothetical protein
VPPNQPPFLPPPLPCRVPYFGFRFFGLDMWGWVIGFLAFSLFASFGFFALCLCNCCGRVRIVQTIFRRRRDAMPFMDMVSNKFTLLTYNALLFVFPFCLLSTFVIGGSLLTEPSRSFAPAGPATDMKLLCSPIVSSSFYELATQGIQAMGSIAAARGILPPAVGSPEHARAIATVTLDLTWRAAFEPIEVECDSMLVAPLPTATLSTALPRVAVALRDESGLVAGMAADAAVYVQLRHQPSDTFAVTGFSVAADEEGLYSGSKPRRPWCLSGGCGGLQLGCSTQARLAGTVVQAAGSGAARAVRLNPMEGPRKPSSSPPFCPAALAMRASSLLACAPFCSPRWPSRGFL